jgi:hypothetical protein
MSAPDDEELLVGPPRIPWWVFAIATALAVGVAAVLLVPSSSHPRANVTPAPITSPAPLPVQANELELDSTGEPVVDAVVDGDALVVMRTDSLVRVGLNGKVQTIRHLTGDAALGNSAPGVRLLIDGAHGIGWAVATLERQARVLIFHPQTLRPLRVLYNNFIVYDTVLYRGRMYAATSEGIAWLDPSGATGHVPHVTGYVLSLAVDARRRRLLAVLGGDRNRVVAVTPGGGVTVSSIGGGGIGQVRVVDGRIWVAGSGVSGALLVQLDPDTLRPALRSKAEPRLSPDAVVVGVGSSDLFLEAGEHSTQLFCVDARSGRVTDEGPATSQAVAATSGTAIAIVGRHLLRLHLTGGCTG